MSHGTVVKPVQDWLGDLVEVRPIANLSKWYAPFPEATYPILCIHSEQMSGSIDRTQYNDRFLLPRQSDNETFIFRTARFRRLSG